MRTVLSIRQFCLTTFSIFFFLLTACTQGGFGPNGTAPMGAALDGINFGSHGATSENSDGNNPNEEDGVSESDDSYQVGILQHAPALDAGEVAPMPDVGLEPVMTLGTTEIICQGPNDEVLLEMAGRVRAGDKEDNESGYHDIDPGELGMTLRVVNRETEEFIDFQVSRVNNEDCLDEVTCPGNHFVARFNTVYPFPTTDNGKQIMEFWISQPNHQAASYNKLQACPESNTADVKQLGHFSYQMVHMGTNTYCHPPQWEQVWTQFHSWENPPNEKNIPPCQFLKKTQAVQVLKLKP